MAAFDRFIFGFCTLGAICAAIPPHYSPRIVRTKYGSLRGILLTPNPIRNSGSTSSSASSPTPNTVEAFLGVPYAAPPVGSLRYLPPASPGPWPGVRLASSPGPACPQRPPDLSNRTAALQRMSRNRYFQLQRMAPLLSNQSEDCLYLNLYSPFNATGTPGLPIIVFIHGYSYSYGAGHLLDGAPLAGMGQIVITLNYRLGVLGFLQTSLSPTPGQLRGTSKKAAPKQGNFGLLDIIAALIWLKDNAHFFGGDAENVCLVGQGTGAALVNLLMISPIARGLFKRAVLMSGSALSPWAMVRDPGRVKEEVAKQMRCSFDANPTLTPGQIEAIDISECLRKKPLGALLSVELETPRFLTDFGPFVDGSIIETDPLVAMENGSEGFASMQLLTGVTTTESMHEISDVDLRIGFEEDRRDRVIRTLVRNTYVYHLNEIFYVLKNEYTDWDRPIHNAVHVRDSVLALLGDGLTVAPLLGTAQLHAGRGGATYFYHFDYSRSRGDSESERLGSLSGDDLNALGLDATDGSSQHYTSTATSGNANNSTALAVSDLFVHYILAFAASGDPNSSLMPISEPGAKSEPKRIKWDRYERTTQAYMCMSARPKQRTHYRGHQMSIWLQLIPQLHQPGPGDVPMTHHQLSTSDKLDFEGVVRPPTITRSPPMPTSSSTAPDMASFPERILECTTNVTADQVSSPTLSPVLSASGGSKEEDSQVVVILSQSAALSVTLAIGVFLLLINLVLFGAIYRQRSHGSRRLDRKEPEQEEGLFDSTSDVREICVHPPRMLAVNGQVPRDKYEPASNIDFSHPEATLSSPSFYMTHPPHPAHPAHQFHPEIISVPIPVPPPPPRSSTPYHEGRLPLDDNGGTASGGTLSRGRNTLTRSNSLKTPATPSLRKKVQIQEITV